MTAPDPDAAMTTAEALAALAAALSPGRPYPVAVPSSSEEGVTHLVVVAAGRVSSCDCRGWQYRRRNGRPCQHALLVAERLTAVTAAVHAAAGLLAGRAAVTFPDAP